MQLVIWGCYILVDYFCTLMTAISMQTTGGYGLLPCRECALWYCRTCQVGDGAHYNCSH